MERLRWFTPNFWLPHGVSGLIALSSGAVLFGAALGGWAHTENGELRFSMLTTVYFLSSLQNALAGLILSLNKSKLFTFASILQMHLLYFGWRFSRDATGSFLLDKVLAVSLITCITSLLELVWVQARFRFGIAVAYSITFSACSLFLLSLYPLQLAFERSEWYHCILTFYPMQRVGFVSYVFVPATFGISWIMFCATLMLRRLISEVEMAFIAFIVTDFIIVSTVVSQEIHIPWVSTQKLHISCPPSDTFFDVSVLARYLLKIDF